MARKCLVVDSSTVARVEAGNVLHVLGMQHAGAGDGELAIGALQGEVQFDAVLVGEWKTGSVSEAQLMQHLLALQPKPKIIQWFNEDALFGEGEPRPTLSGYDSRIFKPLDRVEVIIRFSELGLL